MKKCRYFLFFICLIISGCFMIGDVMADNGTIIAGYSGCKNLTLNGVDINNLSFLNWKVDKRYNSSRLIYALRQTITSKNNNNVKVLGCKDDGFRGWVVVVGKTNEQRRILLTTQTEWSNYSDYYDINGKVFDSVKLTNLYKIKDSADFSKIVSNKEVKENADWDDSSDYSYIDLYALIKVGDRFKIADFRTDIDNLKNFRSSLSNDQKDVLDSKFSDASTNEDYYKFTGNNKPGSHYGETLTEDPLPSSQNSGGNSSNNNSTSVNTSETPVSCVIISDKSSCNNIGCVYNDEYQFCSPSGLLYLRCGNAKDIPYKVPQLASFAVTFLKIVTPLVLILVSVFQLVKAITSNKEDDMKKAQASLIKRIIAGALVFFVITIFQFIMLKLADNDNEKADIKSCLSCLLNGPDKCDALYYKDGYGNNYSAKDNKIIE